MRDLPIVTIANIHTHARIADLSIMVVVGAYAVAAAESGVHAVWQDQREGSLEIFYARAPGTLAEVDNGLIAFAKQGTSGLPQIHTIQPDGTDERQLTSLGTNMLPAWSDDGAKIAFASNRTGSLEIWIMDADGSNQTRITCNAFTPPGGNFVPDWAPDGTRFAYGSARPDVGHSEVWTINIDGTNQTRLTFTPQNPPNVPTWSIHPSWSPDGERIVYASTFSGSSQIWMMNADGTNRRQLTETVDPLSSDNPV